MATIPFWSRPIVEVAQSVNSSIIGLREKEAQEILLKVA
jgi:hypothetical protein